MRGWAGLAAERKGRMWTEETDTALCSRAWSQAWLRLLCSRAWSQAWLRLLCSRAWSQALCSHGRAWSPGPPLPSMHGLRRCPATPRPCMLAPHAPGPRLPSPPRHTAPPLYLVCAGRQVADVACMIPGGCSRGGGT